MDPEVVILGADGTEHVFPPGFDPKRAAEIVRGGAKPAAPSALSQLKGDTGHYLAQTIRNIPGDIGGQLKGIASLAGNIYGAGQELGSDAVSLVRDVAGADPQWQQARPNQDALKHVIPGIIQHYADYLDPEKAAAQVRDHPVGTAMDVYGAVKGGQAAVSAAKKAAPGVISAAKSPVAGMVMDRVPVLGGLRRAGRAVDLGADALERMNGLLDRLKSQPVASQVPATPAASLADELLKRNSAIDWRLTDAVPIDAMKRSIEHGGTILEAGESQVGLSERLAAAMKNAATDPKAAMEAELLSRALRQRMHIRQGATK